MSEYAKALVPLGVGLVVGVALILAGERETGIAVLLAAAGASGLSFAVPNRPAIKPVRDLHQRGAIDLMTVLVVLLIVLVIVVLIGLVDINVKG